MAVYNIDKVIPEDKEVIIDGRSLKVPGKLKVYYVLKMLKASNKLTDEPGKAESVEYALDTLYEIFCIKNEEIDKEWVMKSIDVEDYIGIVNFLSSSDAEDKKIEPEKEKKN
jgi:hypothetical protein